MKVVIESAWLRHPKIWWSVFFGGIICTLGLMMFYRDVPTTIGVQYDVPSVEPGETIRMVLPVLRNLSRGCSVTTSRAFIDSTGASENLPESFASAEAIEVRERETPGQLILNVRVPPLSPSGPAKVRTENRYRCPMNPTTWLWPIEDSWTYNLVVKAK